jgi:hypothetical protein
VLLSVCLDRLQGPRAKLGTYLPGFENLALLLLVIALPVILESYARYIFLGWLVVIILGSIPIIAQDKPTIYLSYIADAFFP